MSLLTELWPKHPKNESVLSSDHLKVINRLNSINTLWYGEWWCVSAVSGISTGRDKSIDETGMYVCVSVLPIFIFSPRFKVSFARNSLSRRTTIILAITTTVATTTTSRCLARAKMFSYHFHSNYVIRAKFTSDVAQPKRAAGSSADEPNCGGQGPIV